MHLFRYARDYYGDPAAQQLSLHAALLLLALAGILIAAHLLRRSAGAPVSNDPTSGKLPPQARLRKYEAGARLYHWGNLIFLLGLAISGAALFAPGSTGRAPSLLLHELFAAGFVLALLLHIVIAPRRGEGRSMWFERRDWRDLGAIVSNFLGRTRHYPAFGKYDPLQKLYHAFITLLSAALIFSGVYLLLSAEVWATFAHIWMRDMRLIHDVAAFAFIAIIVGHIYFGIIRVNWPQLAAIVTGRLRGSDFNLYHDARRWQPKEERDQ